ncbi:MAG: acetate--CoA ligase family protein, partial [Syntrophomonadaceae bacterium]|nr:acetate--CoA ligase family protein [Syntrophomonadaceae bacterium]
MNLDTTSLHALFKPKSIAIIGASSDVKKIGGRAVHYLKKYGYSGKVYPINPLNSEIQGIPAYHSILEVPERIDLAVLAIPANMVLEALEQCAKKNVGSAILFSAGFAETGEAGLKAQERVSNIAKENGIRLLGPNCMGFVNVADAAMGTFSLMFLKGLPKFSRIGFVSQSGALGAYIFSRGREIGMGFSYWISTGNEVDVQIAECIAFLAEDPNTDIIAVQAEGIKDGEKLKAALQIATEKCKPVVMLKTGTSVVGTRAVASHTASMVGSDAVFDAMLKQYGVYRVKTLRELVEIPYTLSQVELPQGNRVCVFTNSGGVGIMLADDVTDLGLEMPQLSEETQKKLLNLIPYAGVENPIDITATIGTQPELLKKFLELTLEEGIYDQFIIFLGYSGLQKDIISMRLDLLEPVRDKYRHIPMLWANLFTDETRQLFANKGMPVFEDPLEAAKTAYALSFFAGKFRNQRPHKKLDISTVQEPDWPSGVDLTEDAAKAILAKHNIPVTIEKTIVTEEDAIKIAKQIGFPVVLKGMSPDILHKTEAGIVYLNIYNEKEVSRAFKAIDKKIKQMKVRYNGISVQEML